MGLMVNLRLLAPLLSFELLISSCPGNAQAKPESVCKAAGDGSKACKESGHDDSVRLASRCTIDRVSVFELTPEQFRSKYYLKRPLIVTDVSPDPEPSGWSVAGLLKDYGDAKIRIGSSRTIVKAGGSGGDVVALRDLVKTLQKSKGGKDVDIYGFDRNSLLFKDGPELIKSIENTAWAIFGDGFEPGSMKNGTDGFDFFFSLGGKGSGVHLHHHEDGWLYLFEGYKRWFLQPPHVIPPITHMSFISMRYWLNSAVYPKLAEKEMPTECTQEAGELIYVPEGWWHGTINEGDPFTLSVASQRRMPLTMPQRKLVEAHKLKVDEKYVEASKLYEDIVKADPQHAEAWYLLGVAYGKSNQTDKEFRAKKKANKLTKSRNCDVLGNLATGTLHADGDPYKAEKLLRKAMELCSWDHFNWLNLAAVLESQGDMTAAEEAFDHGKEMEKKWYKKAQVRIGKTLINL